MRGELADLNLSDLGLCALAWRMNAQQALALPSPVASNTVIINARCSLRIETDQRVIVVAGLPVHHHRAADAVAEAYAMVFLVELGRRRRPRGKSGRSKSQVLELPWAPQTIEGHIVERHRDSRRGIERGGPPSMRAIGGGSRNFREGVRPVCAIWQGSRNFTQGQDRGAGGGPRSCTQTVSSALTPTYGPAVRCRRFPRFWLMRSCINVSGF